MECEKQRERSQYFGAVEMKVVIWESLDFPMPGTRSRSATVKNGPCLSRSLIIRPARVVPIPGKASKSAAVAVLMLIVCPSKRCCGPFTAFGIDTTYEVGLDCEQDIDITHRNPIVANRNAQFMSGVYPVQKQYAVL